MVRRTMLMSFYHSLVSSVSYQLVLVLDIETLTETFLCAQREERSALGARRLYT